MVLVNSKKSDIFTCNVKFSDPYQSDSDTNVKQPEGKVNFIFDRRIGYELLPSCFFDHLD
jgi:hypothetical protein